MPQTVHAQQPGKAVNTQLKPTQNYKISYVDEQKLFQKGDEVTLVSLKLEWPERISSTNVAVLQDYLCSKLFGNDCHSLREGMKLFYASLGEEIKAMPEATGIKRKNITLTLTEMAWEKDRYVSYRLAALHRDGDTPNPIVNVQRLFTYDVAAEKILTTTDLIKGKYMPDKLYHTEMVALIAMHMPQVNKTMYSDDIPDHVCLLGKSKGVAFNLKGIADEDGMDMIVNILRDNILNFFLTSKAIKLLDGVDAGKKGSRRVAEPEMEEVMEDGQPIYFVVDSMPRYPEGMAKMKEFIMQQLTYPQEEKKFKTEGRVVVSFVVGTDGRVCHPAVNLPLSPAIDRAAVKAVLDMKPWIPGKMNGTPVNVRMTIPLVFKM